MYEDAMEGTPFHDLSDDWQCPICNARKTAFRKINADGSFDPLTDVWTALPGTSERLMQSVVGEIQMMAYSGTMDHDSMDTLFPVKGFDRILLLGAQLSRFPLDADAGINIRTVIGKNAKKPMIIETPVYISHMSFGSISKNAKIALSMGSAAVKTAIGSGEGGILPEERKNAYRYIFEYVPNLYSVTDENLKNADAIEIKIGQGTKPGMGGFLPGNKVTADISAIRNKPAGEDILSPSRFENVKDPDSLKLLVDDLRKRSDGRPIGIKIAAGHVESDLDVVELAEADFVTIDGRGGSTGSSNSSLRDASSVPTVFALSRARRHLDAIDSKMDLVITGGLRTSRDVVKALAMGADAVAMASSPLIALGCQRYRVCHQGTCPMGIATQDPDLSRLLVVESSAKRVENFLNVVSEELRMYCRCTGVNDIHDLSVNDLCTDDINISSNTDIRHAGSPI